MQGFLAQLRRYGGFVAWFFKDALLRYRGRLVLIIVANVAGVALQAAAVLIAYRYAAAVAYVDLGQPSKAKALIDNVPDWPEDSVFHHFQRELEERL